MSDSSTDELANGADQTSFVKALTPGGGRARAVILEVHRALEEKGYNPVSQLVGYLLSGDPTYITSHRDARNIVKRLDRDELLEELVAGYINSMK